MLYTEIIGVQEGYGKTKYHFFFGFALFLSVLHFLQYIKQSSLLNSLMLTLSFAFGKVIAFFVSVAPIFLAYLFFGISVFGKIIEEMKSIKDGAVLLFSLFSGDVIYSTFYKFNKKSRFPFLGEIYLYTFVLFFITVVFNISLLLIESAFHSSEKHKAMKKRKVDPRAQMAKVLRTLHQFSPGDFECCTSIEPDQTIISSLRSSQMSSSTGTQSQILTETEPQPNFAKQLEDYRLRIVSDLKQHSEATQISSHIGLQQDNFPTLHGNNESKSGFKMQTEKFNGDNEEIKAEITSVFPQSPASPITKKAIESMFEKEQIKEKLEEDLSEESSSTSSTSSESESESESEEDEHGKASILALERSIRSHSSSVPSSSPISVLRKIKPMHPQPPLASALSSSPSTSATKLISPQSEISVKEVRFQDQNTIMESSAKMPIYGKVIPNVHSGIPSSLTLSSPISAQISPTLKSPDSIAASTVGSSASLRHTKNTRIIPIPQKESSSFHESFSPKNLASPLSEEKDGGIHPKLISLFESFEVPRTGDISSLRKSVINALDQHQLETQSKPSLALPLLKNDKEKEEKEEKE
eukprot:TRINITY_DN3308_c0_g1_i2.p1 TRINITY_DN3308_c0_g1~~TRINITY_DN3308_c0_g1_i2.p1  ORF type:complete len:598 (+),score=175.39 TRINITY_DN3308_c0_g1_i2:46-1794(+)